MTAHSDPIAAVAAALVVILVVAKLAGHVAARVGQPAVLGELMGGVLIGNLSLTGFTGLDVFKTDFANIGLGLTLGGHSVIAPATYSAIVVMVMVTTMVTPPALKWSLARNRS
jgi:Kef-type K+ transport system membrane component KefB